MQIYWGGPHIFHFLKWIVCYTAHFDVAQDDPLAKNAKNGTDEKCLYIKILKAGMHTRYDL